MSNTINSEIKFNIELDENRVPEKLTWSAQDGGVQAEEAKAIMFLFGTAKLKKPCVLIYGQKICRLMK